MSDATIAVAGATGDLGERITRALRARGARVTALVRRSAAPDRIQRLQALGATIAIADLRSTPEAAAACAGASCVVSALAGLRDVIVDAQAVLLEGAVQAGVPRFIPSDFSIDFTKFPAGQNRNLDLRREFHGRLERARIAATTIFNGAFSEMLATGQMPVILFGLRRVLHWGSPDQRMDFTTRDDTAAFTARAALEAGTPRFLRIAGDELSVRELAAVVGEVTGERFRPLRAGGLGMLDLFIRLARALSPGGEKSLYPAWQGMQYLRNMLDGRAKLDPLDNARHPDLRWTPVRDVLRRDLGRPSARRAA